MMVGVSWKDTVWRWAAWWKGTGDRRRKSGGQLGGRVQGRGDVEQRVPFFSVPGGQAPNTQPLGTGKE